MGLSLLLSFEKLLDAGCVVGIKQFVCYPPDESAPSDIVEKRDVMFPDGYIHRFDDNKTGVECDYNGWGSNFQLLHPRLARYHIEHEVV